MKIHFLKQDCLEALKSNIPANIEHYGEPTNAWIYRYFGDEDPFVEYQAPVEELSLSKRLGSDEDSISALDVEDSKRLYTALRELTPSQAVDERLWAGMCHGDLWEYLYYRWRDARMNTKPDQSIKSRYFFGQGTHRSLFTNSLARLWWVARLTYDPKRENPFELLSYFSTRYYTKSIVLFSSNFMSNPEVSRGLISALVELEAKGFLVVGSNKPDEIWSAASRYLNVFGGTHILDLYTEEEIKQRVLNYMYGLPTAVYR